jgi:hypothetical protein
MKMADIYGVSGDASAMNTANVLTTGEDVCAYAKSLSTLLGDFDGVMTSLTSEQMSGYMSESAFNAYSNVKDSLEGYAQQINAVGLSIQSSANNMNAAAQQAGDNIYA